MHMFIETILIGINNFFSPGSAILSLTLCFLLLVFAKNVKIFWCTATSYVLSVVVLYFMFFQNHFAYVRYEIFGDAYIYGLYAFFIVTFLFLGGLFFLEWLKLKKNKNSKALVRIRFEEFKRESTWKYFLIGLISVGVAIIVGFLSADTVDSRVVLQFLFESLVMHDWYAYYGVLFLYVAVLLVPVFCVCFGFFVLRRRKEDSNIFELRMFMILLAAFYFSAGLGLAYIM